jgi:hypothetical protein
MVRSWAQTDDSLDAVALEERGKQKCWEDRILFAAGGAVAASVGASVAAK